MKVKPQQPRRSAALASGVGTSGQGTCWGGDGAVYCVVASSLFGESSRRSCSWSDTTSKVA